MAALAAGKGQDAGKLDEKERDRLRQQALTWLREDLADWSARVAEDPAEAELTLRHWQNDADLAGVRDREALENRRQPRARPKSVSLTRCTPFSSRMLAGLTSRWMTPWAGALANPAAACMPMRRISLSSSGPLRSSRSWSERPLGHEGREAADGEETLRAAAESVPNWYSRSTTTKKCGWSGSRSRAGCSAFG
jgi:hypothetical protein